MLHKIKLTPSYIHPLVYITFALIAGIWWQYSSGSLFTCCLLAVACGVTAFVTQIGWRNICLFLILLCSTCATGAFLLFVQHKNHSLLQKRLCATPCCIRGTISGQEPSSHPAMNSCLLVSIDSISFDTTSWHPESGTIQIYTHYNKELLVGDYLELRNITLKKTTGSSFDNYLTKNDIAASLFTNDLEYTLLHRPSFSIKRIFWQARDGLSRRLRSKFSRETASMFLLVFLGTYLGNKKSAQKTKDLFRIWGILHFLARSGLHLVIFIVMWEFLLSFIPLSFAIKQIILILFSILYALLSWPSMPFMRAFSTFLLYKVGPWTNTRSSSLYLLALVCFFILLINPIQLLFLDFQLSFGLTFVLAWFSQQQQQKRIFA